MAYRAKDGQDYSLMSKVRSVNASMDAKSQGDIKKNLPDATTDDQAQPQDITQDAKAMDLVDQLKQMGYTGEDVEKAMGDGMNMQQSPDGAAAAKAAPLQIPGLG